MSTCHTYATLDEAALAVVRIYGPCDKLKIIQELKGMRSQFGFTYYPETLPAILDRLQEAGEIEWRAGLWRAK